MVALRQDDRGNFVARKRLPNDVRDEYGRRYGQRLEAKFFVTASAGTAEAKRLFHEWQTEITTRIDAIRAERTGEGMALTLRQARALAGEWYEWFIAKHPESDHRTWETLRDKVQDALKEAIGPVEWEHSNPDDLWREDAELRKAVRPALSDVGETAQFLASKGYVLNAEARDHFLDWLYDDLAAALRRLRRLAKGDYRSDKYAERFPKFDGLDTGETPPQLFDKWVAEKQPADSTVESWSYVFAAMANHFPGRSAASITPDEAQDWVSGLVTPERSAATVDNNYIAASKTVFGWAMEHKHLSRNPFAAVKVTVPKRVQLRETKAFRPDERQTILKAALAITNTERPDNAARRWVPWLCAYTGARPGEMTQLRGIDVVRQEGIAALRITPDAGAVKVRKARLVPLHEHLIEQGFLKFIAEHSSGPLFYNPAGKRLAHEPAKRKKPPAVQARQRLGA